MELKKLYLIAGGTDGYCSIHYTFDGELAERTIYGDPESFGGMDSGPEWILVPVDMTYEQLGVSFPLEDDF